MSARSVQREDVDGEVGVAFTSLGEALRYAPSHFEAQIRSRDTGRLLAEVTECGGGGGLLGWVLTSAGQAVEAANWRREAPTLSPSEVDIVLAMALAEEFARSES